MPQIPVEFWNQVGVILEAIVAVVAATVVAFWVGLALWTLRDIHARTRDIFAWVLATLLVLATGPVGVLLYMLLRPRETLAEVYDRQLEEEALLREISARRACPSCQTVTEPEWLICPRCRTALRQSCEHCGRALELDWNVCPFCAGEATPVARAPRLAAPRRGALAPVPAYPPNPAPAYEPGSAQVSAMETAPEFEPLPAYAVEPGPANGMEPGPIYGEETIPGYGPEAGAAGGQPEGQPRPRASRSASRRKPASA